MKTLLILFICVILSFSLYAVEQNNKGILELKNSKTVLSVGGRIDFRSYYAFPQGSFYAGKIPLQSSGENAQMFMDTRESRLWFKTRTPTDYGPIRTLVEMDFLGGPGGNEVNTNSHNPRLRHAYLEVSGFTVGQTNSAFNSLVSLDTISYPMNVIIMRQPLIRYSLDKKDISYDISFEQPETTLLDKNGTIIIPQDDKVPDIIARLRYYPEWGEFSAAFMSRYITQSHSELSDGTYLKSTTKELGYGINISSKIKVYGLDDIRFDFQYGKGIGRYVGYGAYASGVIDDNSNIALQKLYGWHIGYRHWWNKKLRSTAAFSYVKSDNIAEKINNLSSVNKNAYSSQLNLLWIPFKNGLLGVEYSKGSRNLESGATGEIELAMFLMRYDF